MLVPVSINLTQLKASQVNESYVAEFAADIKYLLRHVLAKPIYPTLEEQEGEDTATPNVIIKGTKADLEAFANTINKEKEYALEYIESGLGSAPVSKAKLELEKSIYDFEETTGIKWPVR